MSEWRPISTAPRDGTWILGINDAGNCAVIIRSTNALRRRMYPVKEELYALDAQFDVGEGRIFPFTTGEISHFWEDGRVIGWQPIEKPNQREFGALVEAAKADLLPGARRTK